MLVLAPAPPPPPPPPPREAAPPPPPPGMPPPPLGTVPTVGGLLGFLSPALSVEAGAIVFSLAGLKLPPAAESFDISAEAVFAFQESDVAAAAQPAKLGFTEQSTLSTLCAAAVCCCCCGCCCIIAIAICVSGPISEAGFIPLPLPVPFLLAAELVFPAGVPAGFVPSAVAPPGVGPPGAEVPGATAPLKDAHWLAIVSARANPPV